MSVKVKGFSASALFKELEEGMKKDPAALQNGIKQIQAIIVITLRNQTGQVQSWILDLKNKGTVEVLDPNAKQSKSDVQIILKDADFVKLVNGKANSKKLFMNGKLKVKGNLMKATAIESVFMRLDPRPKPKL